MRAFIESASEDTKDKCNGSVYDDDDEEEEEELNDIRLLVPSRTPASIRSTFLTDANRLDP